MREVKQSLSTSGEASPKQRCAEHQRTMMQNTPRKSISTTSTMSGAEEKLQPKLPPPDASDRLSLGGKSTSTPSDGKQPKTSPTKPPRTATIREKKEQNQQSPGSTSKKQGKHYKTDMGKNKKSEPKITEEN